MCFFFISMDGNHFRNLVHDLETGILPSEDKLNKGIESHKNGGFNEKFATKKRAKGILWIEEEDDSDDCDKDLESRKLLSNNNNINNRLCKENSDNFSSNGARVDKLNSAKCKRVNVDENDDTNSIYGIASNSSSKQASKGSSIIPSSKKQQQQQTRVSKSSKKVDSEASSEKPKTLRSNRVTSSELMRLMNESSDDDSTVPKDTEKSNDHNAERITEDSQDSVRASRARKSKRMQAKGRLNDNNKSHDFEASSSRTR